ncbi:anhydro-N-acetylmuramic acid kinase AnmK [Granulicatella seriolae]|uniref:Anhydro-N-acetylmuramic acid kinase n=1 Tax=Granulicatella seriolae TaxID=2967226 RepID=A0ABT1WMW7_9LACT|nr:anhydro-N-acetylmuramic acid kinase AnmK [Granulicatella seriolae]
MVLAAGIMSGTSLDGIDVAILDIVGSGLETEIKLLRFLSQLMPIDMKAKIMKQCDPRSSRVDEICSLSVELAELFAQVVQDACQLEEIKSQDLTFVASHGQTIYHQPFASDHLVASTLQIGNPAVLAERLGTIIVSDFRSRDMAVGGQGAPIVPYSEYLLYRQANRMVCLQNIGGIGNVTILPAGGEMDAIQAFDTGPGNMMIDSLCQHFYQEAYDKGGAYAAKGTINQELLERLKAHPYLKKALPKTTGREEFGQAYVEELLFEFPFLKANDFIATVTYFTAYCIGYHLQGIVEEGASLVVGGGGSYNETLLNYLQQELPNVVVCKQEDIGYSSDAKEAIAMAVLGNQTLQGLAGNVPSATGANKFVPLGSITY